MGSPSFGFLTNIKLGFLLTLGTRFIMCGFMLQDNRQARVFFLATGEHRTFSPLDKAPFNDNLYSRLH